MVTRVGGQAAGTSGIGRRVADSGRIMMGTLGAALLLAASGGAAVADPIPADPAGWWNPVFLERLAGERRKLQEARAPVTLDDGLAEHRTVIHAHSLLSRDSRGTLAELVAAAHATRTRAIFMTEHPAEERDVFAQGWWGEHDGVLFVPGAETRNLLVWPKTHEDRWHALSGQAYVDAVKEDGGLLAICHQDTFRDWELRGLDAVEIYNIHVDAEDESQLTALLDGTPDYGLLVQMAAAFRDYPLESMAFIFDDPEPWVRRWDELLARGPLTAIAGNDAHQNTGFVLRVAAGPAVEVIDALGEMLARLEPDRVPGLAKMIGRMPPGTELMRLQLDPYFASFGLVGTYLLAPSCTEPALRQAIQKGHGFVAFDWIAAASGFTAVISAGTEHWPMGAGLPLADGMRLLAEAPIEAAWRVVRDGQTYASGRGRTLELPITERGVYRIELRLTLLDRDWPWVYANPFYVR